MIGRARTYLLRHAQVAVATLGALARSPVASAMTVAVIGITLALPTGLYLVIHNLERVTRGVDPGGQVSLFLKHEVSDAVAERLVERVRKLRGVARVEYVSRAQALAEFKRLSGFGETLSALGGNPLPAVVVVHPFAGARPAEIEGLLAELGRLEPVESAQLDLEWVRRLHAMLAIAQRATGMLAGLLGLAVLLTVGNTIRLAILNRQEEIEVIKLVGGTNGFIRRPFLYAGALQGLLGALTAWAILNLGLLSLREPIRELSTLYGSEFALAGLDLAASATLLAVGCVLGWLGSRFAVGRHLRAIEPR
ncbi:cell division protein FtsX [Sulfurifustis variabilis]|uniref:Cell division protein FtsX n=1 Tax=Sulfurifustis variabilis TaxID=1675686 RepID=A0A1B4V3J2_9GAMM|nr:permease-like cell division protein FtsX [Sulfurifustis variabilis]BAU47062.1 cell division protein FtsX [Sulfurifustis variabilis]